MRLGQLCPSCAGLRQNQENHRFPLAATQTESIITPMLSSLEIQDLPGSEGSRPKLKEYFPRVMCAPTSRDGGCVLHSRACRSTVFLESSRAMMASLELDGCGLESDYPFLLQPELLHR